MANVFFFKKRFFKQLFLILIIRNNHIKPIVNRFTVIGTLSIHFI